MDELHQVLDNVTWRLETDRESIEVYIFAKDPLIVHRFLRDYDEGPHPGAAAVLYPVAPLAVVLEPRVPDSVSESLDIDGEIG